jgi:hypothetical protein
MCWDTSDCEYTNESHPGFAERRVRKRLSNPLQKGISEPAASQIVGKLVMSVGQNETHSLPTMSERDQITFLLTFRIRCTESIASPTGKNGEVSRAGVTDLTQHLDSSQSHSNCYRAKFTEAEREAHETTFGNLSRTRPGFSIQARRQEARCGGGQALHGESGRRSRRFETG